MEIIIGTAASVAATIITVLGAIFYLDRKIDSTRRELIGGDRYDSARILFELSAEIDTTRRELSAEIDTTRRELSVEIDTTRREMSLEIKEVRQSSQDAHLSIREDLSEIKTQQAAHSERLMCIESHLNLARPEG